MDWSSVPPLLTVFASVAVAFAGGVWALIKWGFGGVSAGFDGVVDLVNVRFEEQNARIDARFDAVDSRFDSVGYRFDSVDTKIDAVDKRVDAVDHRIDEMRVDLRALVTRVDALQATVAPGAISPA
ncbi:MAG: hypothetical protein F4190_01835 [Acidimicrobiales bacterium]|nr:hypothetical protein [Acidimicrobiales bacterium]MYG87258.1 hypothetical protein [Acidimicrobiales bacterium]MYI28028.1 hypothetical protein [Acidimicrobiales bacterium]